jgi:hypothetical protein
MHPIHPDVERLFQDEIQPNESLAWSAAPAPSRISRKSLPIMLFGIPWTAFAVFWICAASGFKFPDFTQASGLFPLFGVPFVLIGIGMLSSPIWLRRKSTHTGYYITNRRALLIEKHLFRGYKVRSFYPRDLRNLERIQLPDGSGDIILDRAYRPNGNGGRNVIEIGFFGIPDARSVELLLQRLAEQGDAPRP